MRREKRQNLITGIRKIPKKIYQIYLILLVILSIGFTGNLTGCSDKKTSGQTELVPVDGQDTKAKKKDKKAASEENMSEEQEKPLVCYVHVCGAVKSPGVYELPADSRLFAAIQMAGGLTEEAAGEALNQAEAVEDGSRIYVPTKEEIREGMQESTPEQSGAAGSEKGTAGMDPANAADGKVNINTAAKDELMTLSGIGEAKADAIIRYREEHGEFQKIEDLMGVEGIKNGVFQKVKDQIKV